MLDRSPSPIVPSGILLVAPSGVRSMFEELLSSETGNH